MPIDPWIAERFELIRDIPSFDAARDPRHAERFARYLQDPAPWAPPPGAAVLDLFAAALRG